MSPKLLSCVALFFVLATAAPAFSDGAYRWTDKNGTVFYGSKPPKDAKAVERIKGGSFSRYSGSKVLAAYNRSASTASASTVKESDLIAPQVKRLPVDEPNARGRIGGEDPKETSAVQSPAQLRQGTLELLRDKKNRITKCAVHVENTGGEPAHDVVVAFHFEDGTLIPAVGPEIVGGKDEGIYAVPEDQLPITVKTSRAKAAQNPIVVIDYAEGSGRADS